MRPEFKEIELTTRDVTHRPFNVWEKEEGIVKDWLTPEQIAVKPAYGLSDLEEMEHLQYAAGIPPFLRGPYSTMYVMNPWTIRQYAGFSTAEESNAFYRRNPALFMAFLVLPIPKGMRILLCRKNVYVLKIRSHLRSFSVVQVYL